MKTELTRQRVHNEFAKKVELISGQNLFACYQCGNCTAGCPVAFAMEVGPHEVIRYTLLGLEEETLRLNTFWLCARCLQCTSRCPKGIDIARVMDGLRTVVLKREKGRTQLPDFQEGFSEKVPEIAFARWSRNLLPYYRQNKMVSISEGLLPAIKNEKL
jgi:heterodisulfide reductase subunit C2